MSGLFYIPDWVSLSRIRAAATLASRDSGDYRMAWQVSDKCYQSMVDFGSSSCIYAAPYSSESTA